MIATTLRHSETEARKEELTSVGWDIGNCLYQGEEVHIARNPDSSVRVDVTTTSGAPWLTALERRGQVGLPDGEDRTVRSAPPARITHLLVATSARGSVSARALARLWYRLGNRQPATPPIFEWRGPSARPAGVGRSNRARGNDEKKAGCKTGNGRGDGSRAAPGVPALSAGSVHPVGRRLSNARVQPARSICDAGLAMDEKNTLRRRRGCA